MMFVCKICGTSCANYLAREHLLTHSMTSEEYCLKYMDPKYKGSCEGCGQPTGFKGLVNGWRKYCSTKCADLHRKNANDRINTEQWVKTIEEEKINAAKPKTEQFPISLVKRYSGHVKSKSSWD